METSVVYQPFNSTQLHLLKMFSFTKTEKTLQDLKKLLRDFYIQQVDNEVDKYQIDDQILNEHLRTPYRWDILKTINFPKVNVVRIEDFVKELKK